MDFSVTPKKDFGDFKAGTSYDVLETGTSTTGDLTLLLSDDKGDLLVIPVVKFSIACPRPIVKRHRGPNKNIKAAEKITPINE